MNELINRIVLQIVVVLASLNEQVCLDVRLHLLHRGDEVIVPPVHLNYIALIFISFVALLPRSPGEASSCEERRSQSVRETLA